jgi:acetoacetyl-CoA synthetase
MAAFQRFAAEHHGAPAEPLVPAPEEAGAAGDATAAARYAALHAWSVEDLERFWRAVTEWTGVRFSTPAENGRVLELPAAPEPAMPGARWFPGSRLNYAEHALRASEDPARAGDPAIIHFDEPALAAGDAPASTLTWRELRSAVAAVAAELRRLDVRPGDRVAGYLPNIPQAAVALLAAASVGAVWTSCAPDFGARSVLDRFQQVEPVVLFAVDGYHYNGKRHDRTGTVAELRRELPTLRALVHIPLLGSDLPDDPIAVPWPQPEARPSGETPEPSLEFEQVPFDHPLWILYSSGTTGLPKPIVQGHGGIVLEHLKQADLHVDLGPGDRFFWYTSTGWMMWNFLLAGLLAGAAIVTYDGSPGHPDVSAQWRVAAAAGVTVFGTSAAYVMSCRKAGLDFHSTGGARDLDLSRLKAIGTTGSPLPPDGFAWIYQHVKQDVWLASVSGGTDLCSCLVGGVPTLPVYLGEIQAPALGVDVQAWDPAGKPLTDEVGELVVTQPVPSMPLYFWNDPEGTRYRDSYFDMYPGIWRHGDWVRITPRGGAIIYGRSDATINRYGIRMGTSELYRAVEELPEVLDSMVVDLEYLGRESYMPLFVVLRPGAELTPALTEIIRQRIRVALSARHVPNDVFQVSAIPRTLSGKKMELPIKKLLLGQPLDKVANPDTMANPESLGWFAQFAADRTAMGR